MTWIKKANKLGRYLDTYQGFRIYVIKPTEVKEEIEERPDGLYRITRFIPGELVALDKTGCRFEGNGKGEIYCKIDIETFQRACIKRENKFN